MTKDGLPILVEAGKTIAQRSATYGAQQEHWQRTAAIWTELVHGAYEFTPRDVARFFIADKLVRDSNVEHYDAALDIIGYAAGMDAVSEL